MNVIKKSFLYFHTIRYLKLKQLFYQLRNRVSLNSSFIDNSVMNVKYYSYDLWIIELDNDSSYLERFRPDLLIENSLTILHATKLFDRWFFPDASHLWNFNVQYLEYLIPLFSLWKTTNSKIYRDKINSIINDWFENGCKEADATHSYSISLRIINLIIISEAVDNKQRLFDSIYSQYRYLLKNQEKHLLGNHYLENLKAIVICSVIFDEKQIYNKYIRVFLKELDEEITDDGLHFELSLMYHKIVLEDLIRVAIVLISSRKKEINELKLYISKMCNALYSLENGIGRTPLFNDAGNNVAKETSSLLKVCECYFGIIPDLLDAVSGYYKLYDGNTTVIFDCGKLSPSYMPGHAHCDCLSFELFYKSEPVFVNCGTFQYQGVNRSRFRSTKSHNTVMINDHEQSELWGEHRAARRINSISCTKRGQEVVGEYKNYLGEKHIRLINLSNDTFLVKDITEGKSCSFLHLAPGFVYSEGYIWGNGLKISIESINSDIYVSKSFYSPDFGFEEEIICLMFCANDNCVEHGYKIIIKEC